MKFYHGTDESHLSQILASGVIKPGIDGVIYLTKSADDVMKFMMFRPIHTICVLELDLPEEDVIETFDHSFAFFKCRSYGYEKEIDLSETVFHLYKYNRD